MGNVALFCRFCGEKVLRTKASYGMDRDGYYHFTCKYDVHTLKPLEGEKEEPAPMIHYQCDLCQRTTSEFRHIERARYYPPTMRISGPSRSGIRFDVCRDCADSLSGLLKPRGTAEKIGRRRPSCARCGDVAGHRLHLYRRNRNDAGHVHEYTHTGALCRSHAAPILRQLERIGILPTPETPMLAGLA